MRLMLLFISLAVIAISLILIFAGPQAATNGTVSIDEDSNEKRITLLQGQRLQLSLTTNPTTGYEWECLQEPDPRILSQTSHDIQPLGKLPGSPSKEYWSYNTIAAGSTIISLKYLRKWLPNEPPFKTYLVNIVVK